MYRNIFHHLLPKKNKGPLGNVNSFIIYYHAIEQTILTKLTAYDLIILEPRQISKTQVHELRQAKPEQPFLFGYVSIMQTPHWNEMRRNSVKKNDYFLEHGAPRFFPQWGSYLMDLRSENYRKILIEEIHQQIASKHLSGIFLDTVDDIDHSVMEHNVRQEMGLAYKEFLTEMIRTFPNLLLIQNRGFDQLDEVGSFLHGILWEDWNGKQIADEWVIYQLTRMKNLQKQGIQIFCVSEENRPIHKKTARSLGFIHLVASSGYNTLD
ncbi:endo alpha-1,4 polygalactosaminidase [Fodinisporobacter ferrooxydans]|uniref:Endo alpha-1,4 polygalactosaminidase n=1 Tax=Fodinisporobacter ferrooxydans TaxID=2901836 RepID=A0ABY4CI18_9BACL|nr:endo alpha-1,4 polygalactosaminidase [Alicyclobacillaceae bacterium MYW30-H2]